MGLITINDISGIPPYNVSVCDINEFSCVYVTTITQYVPPSVEFNLPSEFIMAPIVLIKIVDSTGCVFTSQYQCFTSPTPTPSITPSITPTISITPTNTPTISITPTNTPTISITPTITSTPTITPSVTPTYTPTPSVTPTNTPTPSISSPPSFISAILFIEPYSGSTDIGQWMYDKGLSFYGFTNGRQPATNQTDFNIQFNNYVDFSGWTSGSFPQKFYSDVPSTSGGVDDYGNPIVKYNFKTMSVPANTVEDQSWYTWIIPTGLTNGLIQKEIDVSIDNPNVLTSTLMESTIYAYTFTYTGNTIPRATYRVYTSFPSSNFQLKNSTNIYFRGSVVG
jgi:hypothetical protein